MMIFVVSQQLTARGMQDQPEQLNQNLSEESSVPEGRLITDSFGREVLIPESVERVACLYAFSGHVTTMLGCGEDIVAVVPGLKRDKMLNQLNPSLADAAVTTLDGVVHIEELLKMEPDLVFLKGESARLEAEVEKLERFDIPYLVIEYKSIEEQMEAISIIASALNREEKGREFNHYYQQTMDRVKNLLSSLPADKRIRVYHSVNEAVRTDAAGTLPAEWLEICAVDNVSIGETLKFRDNKFFASLEQIYLWDPEVIICNEGGVDEYLLSNEMWGGLKAVKNKDVYQIPIGISRWGHPGGMETPLAILWTAVTLYPEYTGDINLDQEIREFYSRFFSIDIDDETIARIKDGSGMRAPKGE
ncbi:ABC transporter substrate-binding protein [Oceanispirochaeta sp. M2]|nr:ABC transporter substrate-binding protein [Oceanispirochaeta sp. M2]NPD70638.1 ABC transporter substrate-binding protein [Oceanispirochaeta sp. M1]